jgi:hypothetical protein
MQRLTEQFKAYATPEEMHVWKEKAQQERLSLSAWVRQQLNKGAKVLTNN